MRYWNRSPWPRHCLLISNKVIDALAKQYRQDKMRFENLVENLPGQEKRDVYGDITDDIGAAKEQLGLSNLGSGAPLFMWDGEHADSGDQIKPIDDVKKRLTPTAKNAPPTLGNVFARWIEVVPELAEKYSYQCRPCGLGEEVDQLDSLRGLDWVSIHFDTAASDYVANLLLNPPFSDFMDRLPSSVKIAWQGQSADAASNEFSVLGQSLRACGDSFRQLSDSMASFQRDVSSQINDLSMEVHKRRSSVKLQGRMDADHISDVLADIEGLVEHNKHRSWFDLEKDGSTFCRPTGFGGLIRVDSLVSMPVNERIQSLVDFSRRYRDFLDELVRPAIRETRDSVENRCNIFRDSLLPIDRHPVVRHV